MLRKGSPMVQPYPLIWVSPTATQPCSAFSWPSSRCHGTISSHSGHLSEGSPCRRRHFPTACNWHVRLAYFSQSMTNCKTFAPLFIIVTCFCECTACILLFCAPHPLHWVRYAENWRRERNTEQISDVLKRRIPFSHRNLGEYILYNLPCQYLCESQGSHCINHHQEAVGQWHAQSL